MKRILNHAPTAARIVFGLIFFVFGLNGFLSFLPQPPLPEPAMQFFGGLAATGYMLPLIKGVEVIGGLLLLANVFVPLALTLLAPIVVNIVLFHVVLAPPNPVTFLVLALEIYLAWSYRAAFRGVLAAKAAPAPAPEAPAAKLAGQPVRA